MCCFEKEQMKLYSVYSCHELGVVLHVSLQDSVNGSQETTEGLSFESNQLQAGAGDDVGGSGLILEQGALSEVVSLLILKDLSGWLAWLKGLGGDGLSAHDEIEDVTSLSLSDNVVSCLIPFFFNGIGQLGSFVSVHVLQDSHFLEEKLILVSLSLGRVLHNVVESASVEGPQVSVGLSGDSSGTGSVVQQGKLTESFSWHVVLQESGLSVASLLKYKFKYGGV